MISARWTLAAGLLVLGGCAKPEPPPRRPVPVAVGVAARGPVPDMRVANGVVEPLNAVSILPQVGGVLTDVLFKEGANVTAGQLLFKIDPRPYEATLHQAEAVLSKDLAQAENAARDAARYTALVQNDYVTKEQADQATSAAAAARAAVEADRATVEAARLNLEYASIRSPIDGRTGSLLVRSGNVVRPGGTPLVTINQIRPIRVRFALPERDLVDVQRYAGRGRIPVRAAAAGDGPFEDGVLSLLENAVDTATGTVGLKAEFPNRSGLLWPGQFVTVQLELHVDADLLTVPSQSVVVGQSGSYVFVVQPGDSVRMQPVVTGRTVQDKTVIERGLEAGARVVTDGQSRLEPGAKVEIRPAVK